MPPPARGRPYYDVDRGRMRIVPAGGGKAVDYVGPKSGFSPARALRRSGTTAGELGRELARDAERGAAAVAERQPFNVGAFGGFLVTAAAALLGLIVLELILRRPQAIERLTSLAGKGVQVLVDPRHPIFAAGPREADEAAVNPDGTTRSSVPGAIPGAGGRLKPPPGELRGAGGRVFPVLSSKASFADDFNAQRTPGSTGGTGVHGALDIFAARGTPVVAFEAGVLNRVGWNDLGGYRLWVKGASGDAYYAHMDGYAPGLADGQRVEAGQVLGYVGNTGNAKSTPPHLHFRLERGGFPLNPFPLLRALFTAKPAATAKSIPSKEGALA